MTYASFGIHKKLVEEEGYNPSSDEYYEEIDRRLRTEFPKSLTMGEKSKEVSNPSKLLPLLIGPHEPDAKQ